VISANDERASISFPPLHLLSRSSCSISLIPCLCITMNRSGGEAFARLAQQLNRARMQATSGGGGGQNPFNNIPGGAKGFMTGGGLIGILAVGGLAINYSLFNGKSREPMQPDMGADGSNS